MAIPATSFSNYAVVAVLPDSFSHREIEEITNILLLRLDFKEIFFHRESVSACFGAGITTGCVVDVGASKTQITAVFEGLLYEYIYIYIYTNYYHLKLKEPKFNLFYFFLGQIVPRGSALLCVFESQVFLLFIFQGIMVVMTLRNFCFGFLNMILSTIFHIQTAISLVHKIGCSFKL